MTRLVLLATTFEESLMLAKSALIFGGGFLTNINFFAMAHQSNSTILSRYYWKTVLLEFCVIHQKLKVYTQFTAARVLI